MKVSLVTLVQRIREEFEEAPDLRVTIGEAARFWGLDEATCEQVLTELLATGFLAKGPDERYRVLSTSGEARAKAPSHLKENRGGRESRHAERGQ